jgi:MFS family permease
MAAVSVYGITSFVTIYGNENGLSFSQSSLLLSSFLVGSMALETPLTWLSDVYDRRYLVVFMGFACLVIAVYLPIAIGFYSVALALLFIWGGVAASIYSMAMAMINDKYSGDSLIIANSGYYVMESIGGAGGILLIGAAMQYIGSDGLPYVIMLASILFFSFALTRYPVR